MTVTKFWTDMRGVIFLILSLVLMLTMMSLTAKGI